APKGDLALELDDTVPDEANGRGAEWDPGGLDEVTREEGVQLGLAEGDGADRPSFGELPAPGDLEHLLLAADAVFGGARRGRDLRLLEQPGSEPGRSRAQPAAPDKA